jgi:hypothetical protein
MKYRTKSIAVAAAVALCAGVATQAQSVLPGASIIDLLNGTQSSPAYTPYLILDNSHGAGNSVAFSESSSGLQAAFSGTVNDPEQALYLAPAAGFSTTFAVGDTLVVNTAVPNTGSLAGPLDFGLAISDANPTAATAANTGNGTWSSRTSFDWASISLRPNQNAIRVNYSISGVLTTGNYIVTPPTGGVAGVEGLYISWNSADSFAVGYINSSGTQVQDTVLPSFASSSTIGTDIGFYSDIRTSGNQIGDFSDLAIVPEPCTLALCGMGLAGLIARKWRK